MGITVNGKGASSQGAEISFDAKVTDKLSVQGSFAYTDAQLDELSPRLIRTIVPPGFRGVYIDGQAGDRLPGSAKQQGSIAVCLCPAAQQRARSGLRLADGHFPAMC